MALKRREMPLSTFDSRYRDLIMQGTKERVEIRQDSKREAKRLMHLLTTFRARVRDVWKGQDDSKWEPLYGAIIGLSEDGFATVIRPRDQEASHLLRNIKIGGDEVSGIEGTTNPNIFDASALSSDPLAEFDVEEE